VESLHLDYLSCLLSILSTVLVGRKRWSGLLISIVNSAIVCAIGFHTLQFGFIPANLFCIGINSVCMRSWLRDRAANPASLPPDASQLRVPSPDTAILSWHAGYDPASVAS
jgi:hypothetical protein